MALKARSVPVLIAALAVAAPIAARAQSYGTEDMPGGVEAKPSLPSASRSYGAPPPAPAAGAPDNYEAAAPPPADAGASEPVDEAAPVPEEDTTKKDAVE